MQSRIFKYILSASPRGPRGRNDKYSVNVVGAIIKTYYPPFFCRRICNCYLYPTWCFLGHREGNKYITILQYKMISELSIKLLLYSGLPSDFSWLDTRKYIIIIFPSHLAHDVSTYDSDVSENIVYKNHQTFVEHRSTSIYAAIAVLLEPPGSFKLLIASIIRSSSLRRRNLSSS